MILHVDDLCIPCESDTMISNVSFSVDETECVVINSAVLLLGTCLLQALGGMVSGMRGKLRFLDKDLVSGVTATELSRLREDIGFVYRHGGLISLLNVTDNIALPLAYHYNYSRKELAGKVQRISDLLGIQGLLELMPDDLNIAQTRMVNLARALISHPRLILVDAILDGMPPDYKQTVIDAIRDYQAEERFAMVMTTRQHQLSELATVTYDLTEHGLEVYDISS